MKYLFLVEASNLGWGDPSKAIVAHLYWCVLTSIEPRVVVNDELITSNCQELIVDCTWYFLVIPLVHAQPSLVVR